MSYCERIIILINYLMFLFFTLISYNRVRCDGTMYTINGDVYITYSRSRSRLRGEIEIKKMTYPHTKYILNNYKYLLFKIVPEIPIIL